MSKPEVISIDGQDYVKKGAEYKPRKEGVWEVGKKYFVRTVTMALHGVLVEVTATELVLMEAAWIADTGRFSNFVNGAAPNEVEPFPQTKAVIVGRGALVDAVQLDGCFDKQK